MISCNSSILHRGGLCETLNVRDVLFFIFAMFTSAIIVHSTELALKGSALGMGTSKRFNTEETGISFRSFLNGNSYN